MMCQKPDVGYSSDFPVSHGFTPGQRAAEIAVSNLLRASMLDTFQIDGRPIGDVKAGVARAWALRKGHAAFIGREEGATAEQILERALAEERQPRRKSRTRKSAQEPKAAL